MTTKIVNYASEKGNFQTKKKLKVLKCLTKICVHFIDISLTLDLILSHGINVDVFEIL